MTMNRWVIEGVSSGVETSRIVGSVVKTKTDWCRQWLWQLFKVGWISKSQTIQIRGTLSISPASPLKMYQLSKNWNWLNWTLEFFR